MIVGIFYRKRIAEAKVGVAEDRANKIVDEAVKDAEARKKEILLEAKEDSIRTKMNWKKKFVTEETNCREMKDVCSRRKKLWIERQSLWNARKNRCPENWRIWKDRKKKRKNCVKTAAGTGTHFRSDH